MFLRNSPRSNSLGGRGALCSRAAGRDGETRVCGRRALFWRRSGCCELSWFRGERRFRGNSVVLSGRLGSPVGGLAAGRTLTVSPPCAQCDRHPSLLPPCLPLFPCPIASSPSQGKTHPTACPPKMSSSEIITAWSRRNGRTLRQSEANDGTTLSE